MVQQCHPKLRQGMSTVVRTLQAPLLPLQVAEDTVPGRIGDRGQPRAG